MQTNKKSSHYIIKEFDMKFFKVNNKTNNSIFKNRNKTLTGTSSKKIQRWKKKPHEKILKIASH